MWQKIIFTFIYKDKIYNYDYEVKLAISSRHKNYYCLSKIANYRLNVENDFNIDFIISIEGVPYFMYVKKTICGESVIYETEPIINIIKNNKFTYDFI